MYRLRVRAGALAALAVVAAALVVLMPRPAVADVASASVKIVQGGVNGCHPGQTPVPTTYCLVPQTVSMGAGATVTWTNETLSEHTVTRCAASQNTNPCPHGGGTGSDQLGGTVPPGMGATYSFTFTGVGTYYYYSQDDPGQAQMQGEVTVTPAASPTPVQLSPGAGTAPSHSPDPTPTPVPTSAATPTPTPSPSDTSSAVALATPTSDMSPAASGSFPLVAGGNSGGGSPLVVIVLIILTLVAVGGGVLTFRLSRR